LVDDVSAAEQTAGPSSGWTHDWYSYEKYRTIHDNYIERLTAEGIILDSRLSFSETFRDNQLVQVTLRGVIDCAEQVSIKVGKVLDVKTSRGRPLVKGSDYSYHAWLRMDPPRDLIRYCTAHGYDDLHYHRFDLGTGLQIDRPNVAIGDLPTLGDFIPQAVELGGRAKEYQV
jgi:hypothetical protein